MKRKVKRTRRGDPVRTVLLWAVKALAARDAFVAHNDKIAPAYGKRGRVAYWKTLSRLLARMEFAGKRHVEVVREYIKVTRALSRAGGGKP